MSAQDQIRETIEKNDVVLYMERVDDIVDEDDDLAEYVTRLETMGDDAFNGPGSLQMEFDFESEEDDTDASSLADEVEQFLRDQDTN